VSLPPITLSTEDIGRRVLSEDVHDLLVRMIASGSLPPGTKLIETHLARQLGVSQAPVREGLRKLEAVGIVEIQPYRGSIVRDPSPTELINALVVTGRLEALAGELATSVMTADLLNRLDVLVKDMFEAGSAGKASEYVRLNTAFHSLIVEAANNDALTRVWRQLEPFTRAFLDTSLVEFDPGPVGGDHALIVEFLREGDSQAVAAALESHVLEARQVLMDALEEQGIEAMGPDEE
jgi:DNA-binding GntR family transcriptional regulator